MLFRSRSGVALLEVVGPVPEVSVYPLIHVADLETAAIGDEKLALHRSQSIQAFVVEPRRLLLENPRTGQSERLFELSRGQSSLLTHIQILTAHVPFPGLNASRFDPCLPPSPAIPRSTPASSSSPPAATERSAPCQNHSGAPAAFRQPSLAIAVGAGLERAEKGRLVSIVRTDPFGRDSKG